jgi:trk system potassium uptake protein TrkA
MKVMVAGGGAVGRHLSVDLAERGHQVTLIDQTHEAISKVKSHGVDITLVHGDACEPWVLEEAATSQADVAVAVTGDDEDNLVISLLAKQEFGVPRVLARVNHPNNEWMFTEQWGVDDLISPPHIITSLVEEAVTVGDLVRILPLEGGRVSVVEIKIPPDSGRTGIPLADLTLPSDTAILALVRAGHVVLPQPETILAAGDEVVAIASPQAEAALSQAILG